jgi:hypothetical protein
VLAFLLAELRSLGRVGYCFVMEWNNACGAQARPQSRLAAGFHLCAATGDGRRAVEILAFNELDASRPRAAGRRRAT